jgi:hypothetical protein
VRIALNLLGEIVRLLAAGVEPGTQTTANAARENRNILAMSRRFEQA